MTIRAHISVFREEDVDDIIRQVVCRFGVRMEAEDVLGIIDSGEAMIASHVREETIWGHPCYVVYNVDTMEAAVRDLDVSEGVAEFISDLAVNVEHLSLPL